MRPQAVLDRQVRDLRLFLQSSIAADQCQALAPGGSFIPFGARTGKRRENANFTTYVHRVVDRFPLHLRLYAVPALQLLPADERLAVQLTVIAELPRNQAAQLLGVSARTTGRWRLDGLRHLAALLWAEDGHQTIPGALL